MLVDKNHHLFLQWAMYTGCTVYILKKNGLSGPANQKKSGTVLDIPGPSADKKKAKFSDTFGQTLNEE